MKKFFVLVVSFFILWGCTSREDSKQITLRFAAYTVAMEAYETEIIPAFINYWKTKTGEKVKFISSYEPSGTQARRIASDGFEADVAALSIETDIKALKNYGLITSNWKNTQHGGFVTKSLVVIVTRKGNPKNINTFEDLKKDGVAVLYPSPRTSGGAMWVINAIYGSALKISETKTGIKNMNYAEKLLRDVQKQVVKMDRSGRASIYSFEEGSGDALVTYENSALLLQKKRHDFEIIIPDSTLLIENPVAVIDKNVQKHDNRRVAEAFVEFLFSKEAQDSFARFGLRPVDEEVAKENRDSYPVPELLFDIDYLGGWAFLANTLYGRDGIWSEIMENLAIEKNN